MQITQSGEIQRTELPGMLATLCSYESLFGPNHPQTLNLAMQLGLALWRHGELDSARRMLEGCIRSLDWILGRDHDSRVQILNALRDILMLQGEASRAAAIQAELLDCLTRRLGAHHPDAEMVNNQLAAMLLITEEANRTLVDCPSHFVTN